MIVYGVHGTNFNAFGIEEISSFSSRFGIGDDVPTEKS